MYKKIKRIKIIYSLRKKTLIIKKRLLIKIRLKKKSVRKNEKRSHVPSEQISAEKTV